VARRSDQRRTAAPAAALRSAGTQAALAPSAPARLLIPGRAPASSRSVRWPSFVTRPRLTLDHCFIASTSVDTLLVRRPGLVQARQAAHRDADPAAPWAGRRCQGRTRGLRRTCDGDRGQPGKASRPDSVITYAVTWLPQDSTGQRGRSTITTAPASSPSRTSPSPARMLAARSRPRFGRRHLSLRRGLLAADLQRTRSRSIP